MHHRASELTLARPWFLGPNARGTYPAIGECRRFSTRMTERDAVAGR
jgi:hypothetical protein